MCTIVFDVCYRHVCLESLRFGISSGEFLDTVFRQEGIGNRTEPAEPNRTEPNRTVNFVTGRNRTRNRTEPNRTEPRRVRKTQAEPRRTGKMNCRTEPNRTEFNMLFENQ